MNRNFMMLFLAVIFFSGCATTYQHDAVRNFECTEKGSYSDVTPYPVKDFIVKGHIFLESKVTIDVNGEKNGSEITHYMLMKEAEKLGADDIINLKIDRKEEHKVVDNYNQENAKFVNREYKKTVYIYHATALAIKYTDIVKGAGGADAAVNKDKKDEPKKSKLSGIFK